MIRQKNIKKIISPAESTTVEWKQSLAEKDDIIKTIAAFANTEGGKIFVGVSDAGELKGIALGKGAIENFTNAIHQNLDPMLHPKITPLKIIGKQILVVDVVRSMDKAVLAFGRPYKRVGKSTVKMSKAEYERLILEKHKAELSFDSQPCKGAKAADISKEKLLAFIKKAKEERGLGVSPQAPVMDILSRLKLTTKDKKITNAAILLFGKDPQDFFLQAELKAIRFRGYDVTGEMIDFKTIGADAITLLEKAENFIFEHIPMKAWIESGKLQRQEKWLYPPKAIREALANALAHRDYRSSAKVQVRIFDDRMEIWNPGILPPELTFEKLKRTHESVPSNPLIARAFFWIKYAEEVGTGTNKIVQWCKKWGLADPRFEEAGGSFVVTFRHAGFNDDQLTKMGLNDRQMKSISYLRENKSITSRIYGELNGIGKVSAVKDLNEMVQIGLLKAVGKGRALKYVLAEG